MCFKSNTLITRKASKNVRENITMHLYRPLLTVRVNSLNDCSVNVLLNIIFWINMFIFMKTFTLLVCEFFDSVSPPHVKHNRYPECCVLPGVNVIYTIIYLDFVLHKLHLHLMINLFNFSSRKLLFLNAFLSFVL